MSSFGMSLRDPSEGPGVEFGRAGRGMIHFQVQSQAGSTHHSWTISHTWCLISENGILNSESDCPTLIVLNLLVPALQHAPQELERHCVLVRKTDLPQLLLVRSHCMGTQQRGRLAI